MSKFKKPMQRAERFRNTMSVTIAVLVLVGTLSLKYPLAFLAFLVLGLVYAIYRIVKDRKKASTPQP